MNKETIIFWLGTVGHLVLALVIGSVSFMLLGTLTWSGVLGGIGGFGATYIFGREYVRRMKGRDSAPTVTG